LSACSPPPNWRVAVGFGVIWLVMAAVARMSSFAGLTATLGAPIMAHFLNPNGDLQYVTAALAILIFWRQPRQHQTHRRRHGAEDRRQEERGGRSSTWCFNMKRRPLTGESGRTG
jgi:hypothetical protein